MTATIEDLSPEMAVKIFSHYIESEGHMAFSRNVVPVCRTWWTLSSAPSLWKSVDLGNWNYALSVSKRGLLCHTRSLKVPDRYTRNARARKYHDRVVLHKSHLLAVLPNIRDLNALEISNNIVKASAMRIVAQHCPNLVDLRIGRVGRDKFGYITLEELNPILSISGPKLKHLNLSNCEIMDSEQLFTEIAARCPSLEVFELHSLYFWLQCNYIKFPIYKFVSGCPGLRKLELSNCEIVATGGSNCSSGFKDLTVLKVTKCYFHKLDVCSFVRSSTNLECLELDSMDGLVFSDAFKILSNKVKFLNIELTHGDLNLADLEKVVDKWKHTLLNLKILTWESDITNALRIILDGNSCPKLKTLWVQKECVDLNFLEEFVQKCQNLKKLTVQVEDNPIHLKEFVNLEQQVMKFQDSL